MTPAEKLEHFKERCKERGIKLTPQRLIIYERLINNTDHPTVDKLYSQIKDTFPTISYDTVHRTLVTFCEIGVASMVEGTGIPMRFEGNLDFHHHVRCVRCGSIFDFYDETYDNLPVAADLQAKFEILKKTVHIEGLCREGCTGSVV